MCVLTGHIPYSGKDPFKEPPAALNFEQSASEDLFRFASLFYYLLYNKGDL